MIKNPKAALITGILSLASWGITKVSGAVEEVLPFMTSTTFNVFVVAIGLVVLGVIVKNKIQGEDSKKAPSTFILLIETFTEFVNDLVASTMGENNMEFAPYIFTLFSFLIISNLLGLVGLDSPTANYSVTLALALVTFIMSQYFGIKTSGLGGHIKGYFEPIPLLSPLNIIGDLADPISLSFRLFGNILSGGLIMSLIGAAFGTVAGIISPALNIYFDLFSGILQAFIFTMLTMVFVGGNLD